jgi:2-polyprenyl-3-methyl-5-hydroxy-6-metoxy-1,4-benzoquinol methylase
MMREQAIVQEHETQVATGQRFEFGKNWTAFLNTVNDERIASAESSLMAMLETVDLRDKTFLDVGCGSGLFSLAARRLGAVVRSFDYDPASVRCAQELKRVYLRGDADWTVEEGSVLDQAYLATLGQFDVVYSWGVLHHTGNMWQALANVGDLVTPGGCLFLAIYNDEGAKSVRWRRVKQLYNSLPRYLRFLLVAPYALLVFWRVVLKDLLRGRPLEYFRSYKERRGMSAWYDLIDWLGGLPFEVARPEVVFDFFRRRGFVLKRLATDRGAGCNEFVFEKAGEVISTEAS